MDMSTRLDAQIDEHYHATTSRDVGIKPLRRNTRKPYSYLDFNSAGTDPWQIPELKKPPQSLAVQAYKRAKKLLRSCRRRTLGSTKSPVKSRLTEQDKIIAREDQCTCEVRMVESLLAEDFHRLEDGLLDLSVKDGPKSSVSMKSYSPDT